LLADESTTTFYYLVYLMRNPSYLISVLFLLCFTFLQGMENVNNDKVAKTFEALLENLLNRQSD